MPAPLTLATLQQTAVSLDISTERLVNCFPDPRENNDVTTMALIGSHGYQLFGETTAGDVVRGAASNEDGTIGYIVVDNKFYTVGTDGSRTERGTLNTSTGRVSIAPGEVHVLAVDGTNGYYLDLGDNSFNTINHVNFLSSPTVCAVRAGYFVVIGQSGNAYKIGLSELDDASDWPVTNIAEAEDVADQLVSVVAVGRELWALGSSTSEVFADLPGKSGFPLTRTAVRNFGCAAAFTPTVIDGVAYWLSRSNRGKAILVRAQGGNVERIPNRDMNRLFQSLSTIHDAYAYAYEDLGQTFYEMSFPSENQTWTYCIQTGHFFQKKQSDGTYFIGNCAMFLAGKHVIGARNSGRLFELSLTVATEDGGTAIPREVIFPTLFSSNKYINLRKLTAFVDSSTFSTAQTFSLATSADGGQNYRTALTTTVAQNVDYVQFSRISAGKRLTFKLTYNGTQLFRLVNAIAYPRVYGYE